MTEVIFYAYFLKYVTLNICIKYSTGKSLALALKVEKSLALAFKIKSLALALKVKSLALKVRSLLTLPKFGVSPKLRPNLTSC